MGGETKMNNYYMTKNIVGLQESGAEINTKEILKGGVELC